MAQDTHPNDPAELPAGSTDGYVPTPAARFRCMGWAEYHTPEAVEQGKMDFLRCLTQLRWRVKSCKEIGVPYAQFLDWLERDPQFREAVVEIEQLLAEEGREEVNRRAIEGVVKPIYWQGQRVDGVNGEPVNMQWSDLLLIFEMKRRDEQYRDRATVQQTFETKLYSNIDDNKI